MIIQNSSDIYEFIQNVAPTGGATVSANSPAGNLLLALSPATSLLTLTVNFPSNPFQGMIFRMSSTQAVTTITISAVASILNAITSLIGGGYASYEFDGTMWRRIG